MPHIVTCSSCSRELRVPEELLGKLVKCPSCSHTFTAELSSAAAEVEPTEAPLPTSVPRSREEPEAPRRRRVDADEDDDEDDDYADRPRRSRRRGRYYTPHRGSTVLVLGILALVLGLIGIILGPMAWSMGNNDLQEMRAGRMDPEGEGMTNAGRVCGIIATIKDAFLLLCCVGYFLVVVIAGLGRAGFR